MQSTVKTIDYGGEAVVANPSNPNHFMVLEPVQGVASAQAGGITIASSSRALLVRETATTAFEPVVYFPPEDVRAEFLNLVDKTSQCPLKGTASYYDINTDTLIRNGAWQYKSTLAFDPMLARIECCVAFDRRFVTINLSNFNPNGKEQ